MLRNIFQKLSKPFLIFLIVVFMTSPLVSSFIPTESAKAQGQASAAATVPIGTHLDFNTIMQYLKSYVLDKLAYVVAKQILHQLTASVIDWINGGFNGGPSFISQPSSFFKESADQVVGAFLADSGLDKLCSPFSADINFVLKLQGSNFSKTKYECTLDKVIANVKTAGDNITINGNNVKSFMKGDFSQGGWPAFIAMTTEPQNNVYGAYLSASDELQAKIDNKQNSIKYDLSLGAGFLSHENCKAVASSTQYYNDYLMEFVTSKGDPKFDIECKTDTPGSVVAHAINTHLDTGPVELELANDINAIINAVVTQMTTMVLQKGLSSLSGGSGSYTNKLRKSSNPQKFSQKSLDATVSAIENNLDAYTESLVLLNEGKDAYSQAGMCFINLLSSSLGTLSTGSTTPVTLTDGQKGHAAYTLDDAAHPTTPGSINFVLLNDIYPKIADYTASLNDASTTIYKMHNLFTASSTNFALATPASPDETQDTIDQQQTYQQNVQTVVQTAIGQANKSQAQQDLSDAKSLNKLWLKNAKTLMKDCIATPYTNWDQYAASSTPAVDVATSTTP